MVMLRFEDLIKVDNKGLEQSYYINVSFRIVNNKKKAMVQFRYIVNNVEDAITFYTSQLGFKLEMHTAGSFAMLSLENLRLVLSVPNSSSAGGQPMPDGSQQSPGGWNRFSIE